MSKVVDATLLQGVVLVSGTPLPDATILSEGEGPSVGIAVLDEDKQYYIAKTSPDLLTTLTQLVSVLGSVRDAINKIATTFTAVGGGMSGPSTAPPPTLATDVLALTGYATAINGVATSLNTLKGALR